MTDREKLLVSLSGIDDERDDERVTVFEVAAMLGELGEEYRRVARTGVVLTSV